MKMDGVAWAPVGLSRDEAARHVGVGTTKFDEMVADKRMPRPKRIDGRIVWDRRAIEAAFAALPDDGADNPWDRPFVSSFFDRHGRERWRYRRAGKTVSLPGAPGEAAFEAAYAAALEGRRPTRAQLVRLPSSAPPRSLGAAWRILIADTPDWKALGPTTQAEQRAIAERFFMMPIAEGDPLTFRDMPMVGLSRRHVKMILSRWSDRPHAGMKVLRLLRKLIGVALDEEWIEVDPTHRLRYAPAYEGWRAWTTEERAAFEARWPIGSTPRLVFALGLYTGQRRSDLVRMKWTDIVDGEVHVVQVKTGKDLWIPIHPALAAALAATPRLGETILLTQYGRAFSDKAIGMRMMDWTKAAGIGAGATMHGLRKTLGKLLAESGATTRELMDILGHDAIAHAELYSRAAEQRRLARAGMAKLPGSAPKLKVVGGRTPENDDG
jgi:integrase/predicted DNA-binding transcriptional regulator AlpA